MYKLEDVLFDKKGILKLKVAFEVKFIKSKGIFSKNMANFG